MIDITSDKYRKSRAEELTDDEVVILDWLGRGHDGTTLEYALKCRKCSGWRFSEVEVSKIMQSLVDKKYAILTKRGRYHLKEEDYY